MRSLSRHIALATLAAGLTLGTVAVSAQDAPPPPAKGDHHGPRGAMHAEMLAKYDTNKDGKLDETERAAISAERFKQMDKDGDGKIRKADFPAALEAAREAERAKREAAMFDKIDANKDGVITAEEFAAHKPERPGKDGHKDGHKDRKGK